ncbi:unnamed protein product [Rangifer tarandus platyrhynchus]|uniref:Uncharacterized protein n=1 Tax=Rangifer tarandus platyrhynchus TaxID=3082113 RepID=A0AC59YE79_RANTA
MTLLFLILLFLSLEAKRQALESHRWGLKSFHDTAAALVLLALQLKSMKPGEGLGDLPRKAPGLAKLTLELCRRAGVTPVSLLPPCAYLSPGKPAVSVALC